MARPSEPDAVGRFLNEIEAPLADLEPPGDVELSITGTGSLPSVFASTDLAVAAIAAAGRAAARLSGAIGHRGRRVKVDRRLASMWFRWTIDPIGWSPPSPWDSVAGVYRTGDRWIRLHTNVPAHRTAALTVLGIDDDAQDSADRTAVAELVAGWSADDLESAIVAAGGCAAALRSEQEWRRHPQGQAVATEPLIHLERFVAETSAPVSMAVISERPLAGVKVLDLTRVLAGPIATRFVAGLGADVLRLDPLAWSEPGLEPDVTRGKRCARIDLRTDQGRESLLRLLADADIMVHGYRSDALDRLGLGDDVRRTVAPNLIDVRLNAYGWTGPWRHRRGFDSLVQMSSGIAHTGGRLLGPQSDGGQPEPVPLPVQALDHATGYLLAAAALHGWAARLSRGGGVTARVSLARTAQLLLDGPRTEQDTSVADATDDDWEIDVEHTVWGPARRLRPPVTIDGVTWRWDRPASPLGSEPRLEWLSKR